MPKSHPKKESSASVTQQPLEVLVDEENQTAKFANSVKIWHTPYEFYLDFGQFIPGTNKIKINARIVITPQHAASLHSAIADNLSKYEQRFGKIGKVKEKKTEEEAVRKYGAEYVG